MAWRNVWRNRRRTIVTVAAMSLALFAMIQYSGLIEGYLVGMERNILDLEMGDIQIFAKGYSENPSLYTKIDESQALLNKLEKAGFRATGRLLAAGLAATDEASAGVTFRGVDVQRDARVSRVNLQVADGSWLDPAEPTGVVIGRRVAHTLAVETGDEIVVLTQGADGSIANEIYKIRGILKNVSDAVDRTCIFMNARAFRELMVFPSGVHQIILRNPNILDVVKESARVQELVPHLEVKSWRDLVPVLASYLDSTRGVIYAMFMIVYIAIGVVMLNAMLMAVFERIREFGVLKALGVGPLEVLYLIFMESFIQTGLAVIIGGLLSIPASWYLATSGIDMSSMSGLSISGMTWDPIWLAKINANTITGPVVTLVVIVLIAVLYPAFKAALIRPIAAIHHR